MADKARWTKYPPIQVAVAAATVTLVAIGVFAATTQPAGLWPPVLAAIVIAAIIGVVVGLYAERVLERQKAAQFKQWLDDNQKEYKEKNPKRT